MCYGCLGDVDVLWMCYGCVRDMLGVCYGCVRDLLMMRDVCVMLNSVFCFHGFLMTNKYPNDRGMCFLAHNEPATIGIMHTC